MFGKKRAVQQEIPNIPIEESQKIRIMPNQFQASGPKNGNKVFVVLMLVLVVLAIAFMAIALMYKSNFFTPGANTINAPVVANTNVNTNSPTPVNANAGASPEPSPSVSDPVVSGLDASDIDQDGLTAEEEKVLATNANGQDTDSDGYNDKDEILTGNDPRWKDRDLENSDLVAKQAFHDATFLYPAAWYAKETGQLIIIDTKMGDSVGIEYINLNPDITKESLIEWIRQNDPTLSESDIQTVTVNALQTAYKTSDGMKYYLFSDDLRNAFILSYNPIDAGIKAFQSIFEMMVNSLKI